MPCIKGLFGDFGVDCQCAWNGACLTSDCKLWKRIQQVIKSAIRSTGNFYSDNMPTDGHIHLHDRCLPLGLTNTFQICWRFLCTLQTLRLTATKTMMPRTAPMLATANDVTTSMAPFPFELAFKFEGLAFKTAPVFNIQGLNFMILEPSLILPSNARSVSRLTRQTSRFNWEFPLRCTRTICTL